MRKITKERREKGITLIALVVTIVVLLILAGVSINLVIGNNGIIAKATDAKLETRAASVEDKKDLWKMDKATDKYVGTITTKTLEELVNELQEENLIIEDEKDEILEKGHVIIGSKDISFTDGLIKSTYTITNSREEINFNKIILEGDIAVEKPGFQSYSIEGISNSKEGNYTSTGAVDGKSGNLEIIGDIKNATFKYNLTNFMQGDETFYCKVNIDGQSYYKEIEIIQGDCVRYEEDFAGIQYTGNWETIEDSNCSDGKALYTNTESSSFSFSGYGTAFDWICMAGVKDSENTGYGVLIVRNIAGKAERLMPIDWFDNQERDIHLVNLKLDFNKNNTSSPDLYTVTASKSNDGRRWYIDAIDIYR